MLTKINMHPHSEKKTCYLSRRAYASPSLPPGVIIVKTFVGAYLITRQNDCALLIFLLILFFSLLSSCSWDAASQLALSPGLLKDADRSAFLQECPDFGQWPHQASRVKTGVARQSPSL